MDVLAPVADDIANPLSVAVSERDRDVVAMVAEAVAAKRVQLA